MKLYRDTRQKHGMYSHSWTHAAVSILRIISDQCAHTAAAAAKRSAGADATRSGTGSQKFASAAGAPVKRGRGRPKMDPALKAAAKVKREAGLSALPAAGAPRAVPQPLPAPAPVGAAKPKAKISLRGTNSDIGNEEIID